MGIDIVAVVEDGVIGHLVLGRGGLLIIPFDLL
jgi:hypothetical protein